MPWLCFLFVARIFGVASHEQDSNIWTATLEVRSHLINKRGYRRYGISGESGPAQLGFRAESRLYLRAEQREVRIDTPNAPVFRRQCASLRGRRLLRARVRLKDLPKLALTLANDLQEVPR
jgi:hypothetical protein